VVLFLDAPCHVSRVSRVLPFSSKLSLSCPLERRELTLCDVTRVGCQAWIQLREAPIFSKSRPSSLSSERGRQQNRGDELANVRLPQWPATLETHLISRRKTNIMASRSYHPLLPFPPPTTPQLPFTCGTLKDYFLIFHFRTL